MSGGLQHLILSGPVLGRLHRGLRADDPEPGLTLREREVRNLMVQGLPDKIIAELETGCVPWVQPWGSVQVKAALAMPTNAATGRRYSGINVLILWQAVIDHGFAGQGWLTFRQALALGGHVRKGERGTTVVYADRFVPDDERLRAERDGERKADACP